MVSAFEYKPSEKMIINKNNREIYFKDKKFEM